MTAIRSPETLRGSLARDHLKDIDSRGETTMAAQVIEKIAAQVALDETLAGGSSGGFLGLGGRTDLGAKPKTSVEVTGNFASLKVEVALPYPTPLREASNQLRQRLMARVQELTGLEVKQVDVSIAWLSSSSGSGKRRELL